MITQLKIYWNLDIYIENFRFILCSIDLFTPLCPAQEVDLGQSQRLCCDFGGDKTFTTRWSGSIVQVWVQVWAPEGHLAIYPKAVPEGNRRYRGHTQRLSSWGRSPALLWRVWRTSALCSPKASTMWLTQGVFESAAVAAGRDRLSWGKRATNSVQESKRY